MNTAGTFTRRCVSANESKGRSEAKYSVSQIRLHSSAAASAPAEYALLAPYCCEYVSVARLRQGAAHRRSRCDTVFMKRST